MTRSFSFLLILTALLLGGCGSQQPTPAEQGHLSTSLINNPQSASGTDTAAMARLPVMSFADTVHDFGILHDGEKVSYDFAFTNRGSSPLVISSAVGSCGCTVPEYPREPVAPGKSGVLKVTFSSAGKQGKVEKSVTVSDNSGAGHHELRITAEVRPAGQ